MSKGFFGNLINGIAGNLNQMDPNTAKEQYGKFLIDDEEIQQAFTLIRDVIIFTNIRIIIIDKQGTTGKKMSVKSIFLMNIVDCEMETAGAGIDDSEITITYLTNVKRKSNYENTKTHKFEFPKKANIEGLYKWLFSLAYKNRLEINDIA
ncbi:PH domain-containing protein [Caloranaerobacter sp. DY30410]|uniref:PH domain-containing protein n=1 Tax=Caloranaerobacter sp. DY30410 TaxID=3238305 RepID=UPI003D077A70